MGTTPPQAVPLSMADALARLWVKFLPDMEQRVGLVEAAARALAAGVLTDEQRAAGHAAAHKLAGTLGTFGLPRGTDVARQAEGLLDVGAMPDADELTALVVELRGMLESRS